MNIDNLDYGKGGGLIPVIAQDIKSGRVLMQAWMNRRAVDVSLETGKLTFYSRSRNSLWTKGETSGNYLLVKELIPDCDKDSLLAKVEPTGPVCHTGSDTCFGEENPVRGASAGPDFLLQLEDLLKQRKGADPETSYTSKLFTKGLKRIAKKVGEEAVELVLEAENTDNQRFTEEAADLLYHLEVLLLAKGLGISDVIDELRTRYKG